ncbi:MAG: ABC transporter ATP-binding protein [Roseburia sp.]|nr:ABC transporter ATP-binding protein [Anaeroplasma bactoclasticum]MCM1196134.1 ABC transporter ATP-binding protein [Roseburia sp.]MCM1557131.1 ABC transporter ATP-binding protein [Anaeroplasma bactoclasticum]
MMYFAFDDISIHYGKKNILEHITLDFKKGSINTIIGKNGCGKSSLLKTLTKKVDYTGRLIFEDRELNSYKKKELARRIAYLPQIHTSPEDITVRTLVSYGRFPYSKFGHSLTEEDEKMIDFALESAGLMHLQYQEAQTLSGGERQRAWIAMCICQNPEVLILDEPTTYLDLSYQVEVLELIKKLNQEMGITIIMVLHDLNLAARYSNYLYAIKDKKLYQIGRPEEMINEKNLEELFNIKANVIYDKKNKCPYFIPIEIAKEKVYVKKN